MKLKEWRHNKNIGLAEFGRRIGVSHAAVQRYEAGLRVPRPAQMSAIQRETGGAVGPSDFYQGPEQGCTVPTFPVKRPPSREVA